MNISIIIDIVAILHPCIIPSSIKSNFVLLKIISIAEAKTDAKNKVICTSGSPFTINCNKKETIKNRTILRHNHKDGCFTLL